MMYSTASPGSKKQRPTTGYLVRPRLGPVRSIFSARPSPASQDKKKKIKKSLTPKMEFRKKPDYADTAYREAVSRLRIMLADSYAPIKRPLREFPLRELDSAGEDTDNQSLMSGNSRGSNTKLSRPYYHYLSMVPSAPLRRYYPSYYPVVRPASTYVGPGGDADEKLVGSKNENTAVPPQLMSFIEKQEDYIEQLEKESRFCRDELSSLLGKVKDVISENESLHEKQKSHIMKTVYQHLDTETETENDSALSPRKSAGRKSKLVLEGPAIVFESRISELEAQLTQAKIDLKKSQDENENYRKKIDGGLLTDGLGFDTARKQVDALQRDKESLQDTVSKLQQAIAKIKNKETDSSDQVKRSLDVAEQAQYEKNAADMEIRRLKDELDRQHHKLREAIADQGRKISDERGAVERRYTQQIEQLTAELGVQWESTNKLQLELDKQRRENTELRRELAQKQALLADMRKDMQSKIINLQSDIGVTGAEKGALEQQIASLQMLNERNERQFKQETTRLQVEIQSLRQRLDRADADLIHSRRENIRMTEQVASLEKEIKLNTVINEEKSKKQDEVLALPPPKHEISSLIQDMETKHEATVAELEGMVHSQNQLMDKLSLECHTLTQKLDDANTRHKEEIRELQSSLNHLNSRFSQAQITSPSVKDENYSPSSNQRYAQPKTFANPPGPSANLSRSSSKSSIRPPVTSRKNSQDRPVTLTPSSPVTQHVDQVYGHEDSNADQISQPPYQEQYNADQEYATGTDQYDPNQYALDPNQDQQYQDDSNQQYHEDPNQQYATDPNQQYAVDPNQGYGDYDPGQQYLTDPTQQYSTDPNQQYEVNPNQQFEGDPNSGYVEEPSNQHYTGDAGQK